MRRSHPKPKRKLPVVAANAAISADVLSGIALGEARAVSAALDGATSAAAIARIAEDAAEFAETLTRASIAREPQAPPLACRAGCSACCVSKVLVIAPEVIRLADHLRASLDPGDLAVLEAQVEDADRRARGLTRAERAEARVACPLLRDGRCSVYAVRPIVCRAWTSLDVGACDDYFGAPAGKKTPPLYAPQYELGNAVLAGLGKGCVDAGLDGAPLELIAALRIALHRPNAAERWRSGFGVFAAARDEEWLDANVRRGDGA